MKKIFVFSLVFALHMAGFSSLYGIPFRLFRNDRLDLSVEALLTQRKGMAKKVLAEDIDSSVIDSMQLMHHFRWEPGVRAALCYTPNVGRSIEVAGSWIKHWHAALVRSSDDTLQFPFSSSSFTQDYTAAWRVKANYSSQLWDTEGNYWMHLCPRGEEYFSISTIVGMRWVYLREEARLRYCTTVDQSSYLAAAKNRLGGVQGGLCLQINPGNHDRWSFELIPKAALLANLVHATTLLKDIDNRTVIRKTDLTRVHSSCLVDGDLRLSYHPHQGSIQIGYRITGLWNIALAPDQFSHTTDFRDANRIRKWRASYHTAYVAVNWMF